MAQLIWQVLMFEQPGLHVLQDTFCANMLKEATQFAEEGFLAPNQDLFMEHGELWPTVKPT